MQVLFDSFLELTIKKTNRYQRSTNISINASTFSLYHGNLLHSSKAELLHHLESKIVSSPSPSGDVTIVDPMFFIHLQVNLSSNFDRVARCVLAQLTKFESKVIHFVSDNGINLPIKHDAREG